MGDLLLPPKVRAEIQKEKWVEQRARYRARLHALLDFDDPVCKEWNEELRKLDPLVKLAKAGPMAYEPGFPVAPGYYHFYRDNQNAPPTVSPITGADGEMVEPDSSLLEMLRRNDLQNPRVYEAVLAAQVEREQEQERKEAEHLRRMDEEVLEHYRAATQTRVSFNCDSGPWTQSVRGRKAK